MFNFLKICGIGILAVILSPLWISFFALVAVIMLITFIFNTIKVIYFDLRNFFVKDKNNVIDPLGDLPEDFEVRRLLDAQEKLNAELLSAAVSVDTSTTATYNDNNESSTYLINDNNDNDETADSGGEQQ